MKWFIRFYWQAINLCQKCIQKKTGFTYSACRSFTKNKERIKKFKETRDKSYIYKNELDKACFHDMSYGDFKDIARRRASDKVLRDKAFNVAKNPKYVGYQRGLASIVYKFFDKKSKGSGVNTNKNANDKIKQNWRPLDLTMLQLAEELHKPVIRKL